ncbi:MAG: hypothetical protein HUJ69_08375 [Lachnospiraceae bacterium]|nr:hypothetical protein [Lachnospiraceae bacterium]
MKRMILCLAGLTLLVTMMLTGCSESPAENTGTSTNLSEEASKDASFSADSGEEGTEDTPVLEISSDETGMLSGEEALSDISEDATDDQSDEAAESAFKETFQPTFCTVGGRAFSSNIRVLRMDLTTGNLRELQLLANLETLELLGDPRTPNEIRLFREALPGVEIVFDLSMEYAGITDMCVHSDITTLDLTKKKITDQEGLKLCLRTLSHVEYVDLTDTGLTNEECAALREAFPELEIHWTMQLGYRWRIRTDEIAFSTMAYEHDTPSLTSEQCEVLQYCTKLQALDLGHQRITDLSFLKYCPDLRILILADNWVSDITPIGELTELRYLELFANYQIQSWDPLVYCTKMQDLNICWVKKPQSFTFLAGMHDLQRFWASGCVWTEAQDKQVRSFLPEDCEYLRWGESDTSTGNGWRDSQRFQDLRDCFKNHYLNPVFE